jgi:predicted dehydrogenase
MKVLVVGMGSIGQRHAVNFKALAHEVAVCSQRPQADWRNFQSLSNAMSEFQPEYVVIANETSKHGSTLDEVLGNSSGVKGILVEKPLYAFLPQRRPELAVQKVKVAYNMRFHPLIIELRSRLGSTPILGWMAYVGQHLAAWRPQRDYRQVYSSKRSEGGGVIRDLSHEIDMLQFLAGSPTYVAGLGGKVSALESDADDIFSLLLKSSNCKHANIHMNCVDHLTQRRLTVQTEAETFELDFIAGTFRDRLGVRVLVSDRNESYLNMARAFMAHDERMCSFKEGWNINVLIEQAENMI